jgi:serine/threonine-protein kinase
VVLETLGRGGVGRIDLALARSEDGKEHLVALKRLRAEVDEGGTLHRMLLREAALAARLTHPNIVAVQGIERSGDEVAIVMEYLEGHSLAELTDEHLANGTRVPLPVALGIARQALAGLHHAHELDDEGGRPLDLVHRDFTPHNVLVTRDGLVKVLDFGIAKIAGALTRTATGLVKGKLGYMAPEQILAAPVDRRTDVFAAGVVLWEMIAGLRIGRPTSITGVVETATDQIPSLGEVAPWVDGELASIVDRALAVDPARRYPTAAALRAALDGYARNHGILGTPFEIAGHLDTALGAEMRAREERLLDVCPLAAHCLATRNMVAAPAPVGPPPAAAPASVRAALPVARDERRSMRSFVVGAALLAALLCAAIAQASLPLGALLR